MMNILHMIFDVGRLVILLAVVYAVWFVAKAISYVIDEPDDDGYY